MNWKLRLIQFCAPEVHLKDKNKHIPTSLRGLSTLCFYTDIGLQTMVTQILVVILQENIFTGKWPYTVF